MKCKRSWRVKKIEKQKSALKKIIGAMTIGKDVSMLFPNVVKCIHTNDLELKKLVYLYVMNYAKSEPDLVILSVNTFVQDCTKNPNPLVRALAIRTMGCIKLQKIAEYLYHPLKTALQDHDPYVRKTAAICVAKLYDLSPDTVVQQGFVQILNDLLADANPMVVSNALASLCEIDEASGGGVFTINHVTLNKLLAALNECTEWGQTVILNALVKYTPSSSREAESIADRITARLQHANSAVVLGAIRVLMCYMDQIQSEEVNRTICRKMSAPLVTLLSKEPEIQYVALRNMSLILQKRPDVLRSEMKVFFCKYNDPIYVKMEKLEIVIMLATEHNIDQVLLEFKEYATAADIEFVRRAIRAIGRCAIKLPNSAERCIHVLLELIENGFNPVVQESIIVIKDIFRKYPNRYESIIGKLCQNLDSLDEPEAKGAMIWIIGEYAKKIANADALLAGFLENFMDEPVQVQLQLLTATVKLFLQKPKNTKAMVLNVLNMATKECDNPDIRDRGFIYWRLLTGGPKAAEGVVLPEKPQITDDTHALDPAMLNELLSEISNVASVYHKPGNTFVRTRKAGAHLRKSQPTPAQNDRGEIVEDIPVEPLPSAVPAPSVDLLGISEPSSPQPPANTGSTNTQQQNEEKTQMKLVLPPDLGKGMAVAACYVLAGDGQLFLEMAIKNQSQGPLSGFEMQLNQNMLGITLGSQLSLPALQPGQSAQSRVLLKMGPAPQNATPSPFLQVAIKNNVQIFYFQDVAPFRLVLSAAGNIDKAKFLEKWKGLPDSSEVVSNLERVRTNDVAAVQQFLTQNNIFPIAVRQLPDKNVVYVSSCLDNQVLLSELLFPNGSSGCRLTVKSEDGPAAKKMIGIFTALLVPPPQNR